LPNQNFIINELVKFCSQRVFSINGGSNFINNKHDDMELSFQIANHLINYIADYDYINTGSTVDKTVRKGEARDSFAPISTFSNKVENKDSSIKNRNKNLKIKIKFDVDGKKTGWLNQQIRRNGGEKDIMLAIQVVLQKNQKAFLRSWRPL